MRYAKFPGDRYDGRPIALLVGAAASPWWRHRLRQGRPGRFRVTCLLMVMILAAPVGGFPASTLRIGFSATVISGVNENDAMAAMRIWTQTMARELGIQADPQSKIFTTFEQLQKALLSGNVDCISLTAREFYYLRDLLDEEKIVVGFTGETITEEYLLLVRESSRIATIGELRGGKLGLVNSARNNLARIWLDVLLARQGQPSVDDFFGELNSEAKVDKTVLALFFGKLDACVATRKSYATMAELNPQIGRQLKVIASSPLFVPSFFSFRRQYESGIKEKIMEVITRWHLSPAGRQMLAIFQTDSLQVQPVSCLYSAMELIDIYEKYYAVDGYPSWLLPGEGQ